MRWRALQRLMDEMKTYRIAPMDQTLPPSGLETEKMGHELSRADEEMTRTKDAGVSDLRY